MGRRLRAPSSTACSPSRCGTRSRQRLIVARDRLGKKPLFYAHHRDGALSFASELGSLLLDERIERQVDPASLAAYLQYGYVPSPQTMLRAVAKLEPGTLLTWQPSGRLDVTRYWELDFEPKLRISYADALREFDERSMLAVKERLISDVPLGVFLSGGIDSSYVAGADDCRRRPERAVVRDRLLRITL